MIYKITKDNIFTGKHIVLCTLETWAQFGWIINQKTMDKIKEYMPIVSHACNMVSNYSNLPFKKSMANMIDTMIIKDDLIHIDTLNISDNGNDWLDIFEVPQLVDENYPKQKYLIALNIGNIRIYLWRKIKVNQL